MFAFASRRNLFGGKLNIFSSKCHFIIFIKNANHHKLNFCQFNQGWKLLWRRRPILYNLDWEKKLRTKKSINPRSPEWTDILEYSQASESLKVQIWDSGTLIDDPIGEGTANLSRLLSFPGRVENYKIDLVFQGQKAGNLTISLEYKGSPIGGNQHFGGQQIGMGAQGIIQNNQIPSQVPIQGYQQPPIQGYQPPPIQGYQQPPPIQPPIQGYQQPTVGFQQPLVQGYQQPAVGFQQPSVQVYQVPNRGW